MNQMESDKQLLIEEIREEAKNRIKYLIPETQNNYETLLNLEMKKIIKERNLDLEIDQKYSISED